MRLLLWCSTIGLLVAGCGNVAAPAPPSTALPLPTSSPTPALTVAPSATAVPTATPINIRHMQAGAAVNIDVKSSKGHQIVLGAYSSRVHNGSLDGGIPLWWSADDVYGHADMIPFYLYCESGVTCPYILQVYRKGKAFPVQATLTSYLYGPFVYRYAADQHVKWRGSTTIGNEVIDLLEDGKLPLAFTTFEGDFVYFPGKAHGYKVFIRQWDEADPAIDARFIETRGRDISWRSMITLDETGDLVFVLAPDRSYAEIAPPHFFEELIFLGLTRVIDNADQSLTYYKYHQAFLNSTWQIGVEAFSKGAPIMKLSDTP